MSTKGRVGGITEKKRSPLLPKGQQKSSPNPSILDRKKGSAPTESRKVSSSNSKKQPSENIKPPRSLPPSKVTSTRSKPNEKNVTKPSTKTTGSMKPKDAGKSRPPLRSKNVANVKENTNASNKKQTEKGLENNAMVSEQNRIISHVPPSSESDHNIVTHEDDNKTIPLLNNILTSSCDKKLPEDENDDLLNGVVEVEIPLHDPIGLSGNQDMPESEIRSRDNSTIDGSVDQANTNDHDNEINVQDQVNESTSDIASDRLLVPDPKVVDQENEGLEIERVAQDSYVGSKEVEQVETNDQEHEETTQKEPEYEKTDPEEPEHEETDPKEPKQEEREPKEPEPEETEGPKEPEHQETKVPEEAENTETELPEEPDQEETELPEEPDHEETEPKDVEPEETKEPNEPETEVPEEPENKETEVPEDHEETEQKEPETEETGRKEPEKEETQQKEPENEETEQKEPENEETEQKDSGNEETERKEAEKKETERKEAEIKEGLRSKMVVKKKEVVAYGKKETAVAYNDVIEETVSKLREQRKNRVKALVGAFETVISLESDE